MSAIVRARTFCERCNRHGNWFWASADRCHSAVVRRWREHVAAVHSRDHDARRAA